MIFHMDTVNKNHQFYWQPYPLFHCIKMELGETGYVGVNLLLASMNMVINHWVS
jgi:hypothetical protein